MDLKLKGKIAIITGGSRGIGYAVAHALAAEGVNICICARNEESINKATEEIEKDFPVKALGVKADVSKASEIDLLVKKVKEEFGGVDILINNAGTGTEETIMDAPDEKWQYFWDLHVLAAIRTARGFVPFMQKRGGGVILNTASICATQPLGYEPIYNTTKAALVMFSKCLANETIKDNIRVNVVNPGLIITGDWWKSAEILSKKEGITAKEYLDRIAENNTPIKRFATPEELAAFYVFLCSEKASYCVGSSYYVDGGWLNTIN
jgi:3-oxoacyl-[acyl-carrier protein] reductase